ncbi:MAG: S-methyl-5-thioribose-1-phosphate isomerase [Chloroflexota bacterium]|nr:MAG: S-methyl-5-thioribose-1-phosphate isomerase [Chloroflexota bacterium]
MRPVEWIDGSIKLLDQTRLPLEEVYLSYQDYRELATAIKEMRVRGAPAIGVTAAFGVALAAVHSKAANLETLRTELSEAIAVLAATRPTAVNLFWALDRMQAIIPRAIDPDHLRQLLVDEAARIFEEDDCANRQMGLHGAALLPDQASILTHCNAGGLATSGYGTALGVIKAAWQCGKQIRVFADETRPLLQGARLTAWELMRAGIPTTLISDNMAGALMRAGEIDCAIVGADRIAANGDVANKIGTYTVAVLAKEHGLPLYVAAPVSTIDLNTPRGENIPIEERNADEVRHLFGTQIAPSNVQVRNPAFDVTPHSLVAAIVTELGVVRAPYEAGLRALARAR